MYEPFCVPFHINIICDLVKWKRCMSNYICTQTYLLVIYTHFKNNKFVCVEHAKDPGEVEAVERCIEDVTSERGYHGAEKHHPTQLEAPVRGYLVVQK